MSIPSCHPTDLNELNCMEEKIQSAKHTACQVNCNLQLAQLLC